MHDVPVLVQQHHTPMLHDIIHVSITYTVVVVIFTGVLRLASRVEREDHFTKAMVETKVPRELYSEGAISKIKEKHYDLIKRRKTHCLCAAAALALDATYDGDTPLPQRQPLVNDGLITRIQQVQLKKSY
jgi:hypothetical protein